MSLPTGEALVLRAVDFGESDRIVHLLTPDSGRVTAIAKGAKRSLRRFAGTLDVFNHLRVQLASRRRPGAMARLEQSKLVAWFPALRTHPARFAIGCLLIELLDRLAPEGAGGPEAARLFHFALSALSAVEGGEPDLRLRTFFELRALDALGLRPELERCVRCGRSVAALARGERAGAPIGFHVAEGGPVCSACALRVEGLLPVHIGTLRALALAQRLDLDRLDRLALSGAALAEARELVRRFQRFHVGIELRSERFLDEILAVGGNGAA